MTADRGLAEVLEAEIRDPATRYRIAHAIGLAQAMRTREEVRQAVLMLRAGRSRADVRESLMARFRVSRSTAYRIINKALNMRQKGLLKNVATD